MPTTITTSEQNLILKALRVFCATASQSDLHQAHDLIRQLEEPTQRIQLVQVIGPEMTQTEVEQYIQRMTQIKFP